MVRVFHEELVVHGLSVRVEARIGDRDGVGIGAPGHDVLRRHVVRAVHAAAFA